MAQHEKMSKSCKPCGDQMPPECECILRNVKRMDLLKKSCNGTWMYYFRFATGSHGFTGSARIDGAASRCEMQSMIDTFVSLIFSSPLPTGFTFYYSDVDGGAR